MADIEIGKQKFWYLGSVTKMTENLLKMSQIRLRQVGQNGEELLEVLYDHKIPLKLKCKFYKTVVRPTMMYGSKCKKQHAQRWTCCDKNVEVDVKGLLGMTD